MGRLFLREPPYFSGCQQKLPSEVCTTTGQNVLGQVLPSFVNIKTTKKTKSRRNKVNMLMKITNYCSWLSNEITTSLYKSKYHNNTISQKLLRTHLLLWNKSWFIFWYNISSVRAFYNILSIDEYSFYLAWHNIFDFFLKN